jgi:hypothetical protein
MPTLAEVYAMNIQVGQFKQIVPQYEWTTEKFEEERDYFLKWLQNPERGGIFSFPNQAEAWDMYKFLHEPEEIEEDEEFTPSWMDEIDLAINKAIVMGNYNDFGGQQ